MSAKKKDAAVLNDIEAHIARIQGAIVDRSISVAELARASSVPKTTLTGITDSDWNPRAATLAKLIAGLEKLLGHGTKEKAK